MRNKETEQRNKEMIKKAYKYLIGLTIFFFVSAISASVIGGFIDTKLGIKPVGSIGVMVFFYICTLLIAYRIYKEFTVTTKPLKKSKKK